RSRHVVRVLRGQGLPRVQAHGLARDLRLRHGASERVARERCRRRALHRLCLRRRHRSPRDAALRGERPAAVFRERPALPAAVPGVRRMKVPYSWLPEWVQVSWPAAEVGARLTMAGFELEAVSTAAPPFTG